MATIGQWKYYNTLCEQLRVTPMEREEFDIMGNKEAGYMIQRLKVKQHGEEVLVKQPFSVWTN